MKKTIKFLCIVIVCTIFLSLSSFAYDSDIFYFENYDHYEIIKIKGLEEIRQTINDFLDGKITEGVYLWESNDSIANETYSTLSHTHTTGQYLYAEFRLRGCAFMQGQWRDIYDRYDVYKCTGCTDLIAVGPSPGLNEACKHNH